MWGREQERGLLGGVLERGADGSGSVVLVEGEGGIGKTRLLQECARVASGLGFGVYAGSADQLARARGFAEHLPLSSLLNEPADAAAAAGRRVDVAGALDVLERQLLAGPVLVCIEDLHVADRWTLAFVRAASTRVDGQRLVVVASLRPPYDDPDLAHVVERVTADGHAILRLGPLDDEAIAGLTHDIVGTEGASSLLDELERASGNPFFVSEMLNALLDDDAITIDTGRAELRESVLPVRLRLTVLRRLGALPSDTLEDLRVASVLGSSFTTTDLALVRARSSLDLARSLAPALTAGFLEDTGDQLAFRHDLVREAIYEDIPTSLRRAMHREIARILMGAERPIPTVAWHLSSGAEPDDDEAIDWLFRSAFEVTADTSPHGQWFERTDLLEKAEALCVRDRERRTEIRAHIVLGLAASHRPVEAEALAEGLLRDGAPPHLVPVVREGLAAALGRQGKEQQARDVWTLVRDDDRSPLTLRVRAEAALAEIAQTVGDIDEAERLARVALDHSAAHGMVWHQRLALSVLSLVAGARGQVADARRFADEAVELDPAHRNASSLSRGQVFSALALAEADGLDEAILRIREDHRQLERLQAHIAAVERQMAIAALEYIRGTWDDAITETQAAIETMYDEQVNTFAGVAVTARIHMHRGDNEAARTFIAIGEDQLSTFGPGLGADLLLWTRAVLERDEGRPDEALGILELVWDSTAQVRYLFGVWRHMWPDLVTLALAAGRMDLARSVADAAQEGARAAGGIGSVHRTTAWITGLFSADAAAIASAADGLRQTPRRIEAARAAEDAGTIAGDADKALARSSFMSALDLYTALGAARDVDRVRAKLRALGVRLGTRRSLGRPLTGWDALTDSERRVIDLVAEGLTNAQIGERLFVSHRTVQTHLRNVFTKLDVASRTELAAEAIRRG